MRPRRQNSATTQEPPKLRQLDALQPNSDPATGQRQRWSLPTAPWPYALALAAAAALFFSTARHASTGLISGYPFMASDSYDWVYEGFAVSQWLQGQRLLEFPVLRSPVFVLVNALDFLIAGGRGIFVVAVNALSFFGALASVVYVCRLSGGAAWQAGLLCLALIVSPVGIFRAFPLADPLAVAFMSISVASLIAYARRSNPTALVVAGGCAALGGLTQTYALPPFLVIGTCLFFFEIRRRLDLRLGLALVLTPLVFIVSSAAWEDLVPHQSVPRQLDALVPSFAMADFYAHAWVLTLVPLAAVVLVLQPPWLPLGRPFRKEAVGAWVAVAALAGAIFIYQFADLRFTMPLVHLIALATAASLSPLDSKRRRKVPRLAIAVAVPFVTAPLFVAPDNYSQPRVGAIDLAPSRTFPVLIGGSREQDRLGIISQCGYVNVVCPGWVPPDRATGYQRRILKAFQQQAAANEG
jgi:hypothetical protein